MTHGFSARSINAICTYRIFIPLLLMGMPCQTVTSQVYRPIKDNIMWDSYLMRDGDQYQLFFLQNENYPMVDPSRPSHLLASVGRAQSKDLVNWQTRLPINFNSYQNSYSLNDRMFIGQAPVKFNGEYYLFFDPRPRTQAGGSPIYLLKSNDLDSWKLEKEEPVLEIKPPYGGQSWRDLFLSYDEVDGLWHGYLCAQTATRSNREKPLNNFTSVVWLRMPKAQVNAGVFCIDLLAETGQAFEGLQLDKERRWQPASAQSRELISEQPLPETAEDNELICIAMVYDNGEVRMYRNGNAYAVYRGEGVNPRKIVSATIGRPRALDPKTAPNHFIGSVDEIRIYNTPLDLKRVKALKPTRGDFVPTQDDAMVAWTFEDATAKDQAGTFIMPEMNLGAYINNGELKLDGLLAHLYQPVISTPGMPCIAHVTSRDLVEWEYHEPIFATREFCNTECPDYFQIGEWHYMLFSTVRTRMDTGGRRDASGTYYLKSRSRNGPYELPEQPLLFGSGRGRMDNYIGRGIKHNGEWLLYFHTVHGNIASCIARPVTWGMCKKIVPLENGDLTLEYWDGIESLLDTDGGTPNAELGNGQRIGEGEIEVVNDSVKIITAEQSAVMLLLPHAYEDFMLRAEVTKNEASRVGFVWHHNGVASNSLVIGSNGMPRLSIGLSRFAAESVKSEFALVDDWVMADSVGDKCELRLVVRSHRANVFLNNRWVFSTSLIGGPEGNKIGLHVDDGEAVFEHIKIDKLRPLETPVLP